MTSILAANSPLFSVGQQSAFPNDDDSRLQYSYPAPQQLPQQYQSYREPSTSYSTTLPPINHPRDDRWQPNHYGGTSTANRLQEPVFSPIDSYPTTSYQYPPQHPPQGMLPDSRFSLPIATSTSPSTATVRRGPVSVERTATRGSVHTTSPYSRHPPPSDISSDHPPPKKKRKRADAEQLRVLNEVYARTAFPSTEERQELAIKLNMTPRSVQIWYASYFLHHRPHLIPPLGSRTNGSRCVTLTVSRVQSVERHPITRPAPITVDHLELHPSHRMYRPCPCRRIDQTASVRTITRPHTSLHLPPTLLTFRYRAHRSHSKEPQGIIGLRVGIRGVTMTIMTVVVQDVIEYEAFSRRSILLKKKPFRCQNFPSWQHSRFFCCFAYLSAYLLLSYRNTNTRTRSG